FAPSLDKIGGERKGRLALSLDKIGGASAIKKRQLALSLDKIGGERKGRLALSLDKIGDERKGGLHYLWIR
ncbi:MAG: hypothetical protein IKY69_01165, partial [Bacteroidaceae bacterium]|nr:hypothetical protein [Bacteroidaceae bacterium]